MATSRGYTCLSGHFFLVHNFFAFYTPPLKKVWGIMLYPQKKKKLHTSVRPSICLSVHQRFVSGLYLEHLLTNFLQTLYRSSYQEGVVWD